MGEYIKSNQKDKDILEENINSKQRHYGFSIKCLHCNRIMNIPFGNSLSTNNDLIRLNASDDGSVITIKCEHCYNETIVELLDLTKVRESI